MRALVLSCNTGRGHFAAAAAVAEEFNSRGIYCDHQDVLAFADRRNVPHIVKTPIKSDMYGRVVTEHPAVFRAAFSMGDKISSPNHKSPIYFANSTYADNLGEFIASERIDTVISTHMFPAESITYLQAHGFKLRPYIVATDYLCLPFWEECAANRCFVPHADVVDEFAEHGIPRSKLTVTGLPVAHVFRTSLPKGEARTLLDVPQEAMCYLILSGSMGFGGIDDLPQMLADADPNAYAIIVCGHNAELKARLDERYGAQPRCRVLSFIDNVSTFIDASDIVLTKPGGLTSTEVASKRKPLVHTPAIPGFEGRNAVFFSEHGMSIMTDSYEQSASAAIELVHDRARCDSMMQAQHKNVDAYASQRICEQVIADCDGKNVQQVVPRFYSGVRF